MLERSAFPAGDQFGYSMRAVGDNQIHWVISFEGIIDYERFANALRLSFDAIPILGCRLVKQGRRSRYEQRDDLETMELCSLVETGNEESASYDFFNKPLDSERGPFIRAVVIRSNTDTVIIKTDHTVTDAGGFRAYIYILTDIYKILKSDPGYRPYLNTGGGRTISRVLNKFSLRERIKSLYATIHTNWKKPGFWSFPWPEQDAADRSISVRTINRERLQNIKEYGNKYQATVNDVMVCASIRTMGKTLKLEEDQTFQINVTIDLRRFLKGAKRPSVSNLTSIISPSFLPQQGESFDQTLIRVRDTINDLKNSNPGVGEWVFLGCITLFNFTIFDSLINRSIAGSFESSRTVPWVSNLGLYSAEELDFGGPRIKSAYMLGPFLKPPYFMLVISTFEETMTLSISYFGGEKNRQVVERFLDMLEKELSETSRG